MKITRNPDPFKQDRWRLPEHAVGQNGREHVVWLEWVHYLDAFMKQATLHRLRNHGNVHVPSFRSSVRRT